MKFFTVLGTVLIILATTMVFSNIPNIARKQKRALAPPQVIVTKAEVVAAEQARYNYKHQLQINYDANLIAQKFNWIAQNEANR